jgi:hypothetical protein
MSTESAETSISHLFAPQNAAPSTEQANPQPSEQPSPPDVDFFHQPVTEAVPPQQQQPVPGQEQPPAQQQQPQQHQVPLGELIDERKRRQQAEDLQRNQQRRIDQLEQMMARFSQPPQQPQPRIDPIEDPEAFVSHINNVIESRFHHNAIVASEREARSKYGDELVVEAADAAFKQGLDGYFASRSDPHGEAIAWYQSQKVREAIGTDPAAYERQVEERVRARVIAEMRQGTPPPSNITPPLSSATRADPNQPAAIGSDKDFFNDMMNRKRG